MLYIVKGPLATRRTYPSWKAAKRAADRLDTRYGACGHHVAVASDACVRVTL